MIGLNLLTNKFITIAEYSLDCTAGEICSSERSHRKKFRFLRASAHFVKSSAAILNFSCSGRLEREREFYQGSEPTLQAKYSWVARDIIIF